MRPPPHANPNPSEVYHGPEWCPLFGYPDRRFCQAVVDDSLCRVAGRLLNFLYLQYMPLGVPGNHEQRLDAVHFESREGSSEMVPQIVLRSPDIIERFFPGGFECLGSFLRRLIDALRYDFTRGTGFLAAIAKICEETLIHFGIR